jgi:signal transduction histidine kinase
MNATGGIPATGLNDGPPPAVAAAIVRLKVFLAMRWLVIGGTIISALVASYYFKISFAAAPVYSVAGFMVAYNILFLWQVRGLNRMPARQVLTYTGVYGAVHVALDLIAFGVILHYTGGIENPFLFVILLHIVGASTLFRRRMVFGIAAAAFATVGLLVLLEYFGLVPHVSLAGFATAGLYRQPGYLLAMLFSFGSVMLGTAFMSTAIAGELRARHAEVVSLREHLLEEATGELRRVTEEVARMETERDKLLRFLGVAAHDMKTPLAVIQSYFDYLLTGEAGALTDQQRGMLERSGQRIRELLNLIGDLLDIPQIESGQLVAEMAEVRIEELVTRCLEDQGRLAAEKSILLTAEIPTDLPPLTGSAARLGQVLHNLVGNSINYTEQGGVTVRVRQIDGRLEVAVEDSGIGIPPEDAPHVFEDFFRASNVPVRGTGLGLSISQRIVAAHGGSIKLESPCRESGRGSCFIFTLPLNHRRPLADDDA